MRTKLRSKVTLLFMMCALLLAIPAVAVIADTVQNDVVATAGQKIVSVQAGQTSSDVGYQINETGGDSTDTTGPTGQKCNPAVTPAKLTLSGFPSGVDVKDPTSGNTLTAPHLTFTTCGTFQDVNFAVSSSVAAGDYPIKVSDVVNDGFLSADFNETPANFTLRVSPAPSDTTAPNVVSIKRANANPTNASSVGWEVKFDESVTGVDAGDFQLANTGLTGPGSLNVTGSGTTYSVTASTGTGDGTLGLTLVDNDTIVDGTGNKLGGIGTTTTGNGSFTGEFYVIDRTAPTATGSAVKGPNFAATDTYTAGDWTNKDVRVTFTCVDNTGGSGPSVTSVPQTLPDFTTETSGATATFTGTCVDNAGNTAAASNFGPIKIDKSAPTNVAFVGGPAAGVSYDPDTVPGEPTCTANADISGLASCPVTGYSANVGSHTMTATATDNATNVATATRSYSVLGWDLKGFYQPVDMGMTNTAKAGQTVPLKFEMFEKVSGDERTNVSDVKTFTQKVTCGAFEPTEDAIEQYSSGGTSLRYDTTGGQFIFNWQTPKAAGSCFKVVMTPNDTSSNALEAHFKLR
jgi:hypothetical protein